MIITRTPLRISLLGGNTDFREYFRKHGGLVLTSTINKYIYCIVKKRFDDLIYVNYSRKEIVEDIENIEHELVRECLRLVGIKSGIEISFLADIPTKGTGLGSSSSVTVGLLNALHTYLGKPVSKEQLAKEAVKIELDVLKKPIGEQDQWAVSLGGIRTIEFYQNVFSTKLKIAESVKEDFNNSLMLFYTNTTRKSEKVLSSLKPNKKTLDFNKKLANQGVLALLEGDLGEFGRFLHSYWEMKKTLSNKITNSEIDEMYNNALLAGAIGGKIVGAGGGGFLLVMFPANKRAVIRKKLREYRELPFRFEDEGSKVIFNAR